MKCVYVKKNNNKNCLKLGVRITKCTNFIFDRQTIFDYVQAVVLIVRYEQYF